MNIVSRVGFFRCAEMRLEQQDFVEVCLGVAAIAACSRIRVAPFSNLRGFSLQTVVSYRVIAFMTVEGRDSCLPCSWL
jgi:hypothetical protein